MEFFLNLKRFGQPGSHSVTCGLTAGLLEDGIPESAGKHLVDDTRCVRLLLEFARPKFCSVAFKGERSSGRANL